MLRLNLPRLVVYLACALPSALAAQDRCGVERWPVKIWSDRDAARVDTVPIAATVSQLIRVPRPDTTRPQSNRVGAEFKTYRVVGRLDEVRPQSDDSDIHVIIRDLESPRETLITEIPDSTCTADERLKRVFAEARQALRAVPRNGLVEIVGIAFFDTFHGQRGWAPNGIELHPVLRLRSLDSSATRPVGLLSTPSDSVPLADSVWVNTSSRVYHCRGTQWYERTVRGYFATEREAQTSGARPAGGRRCGRPTG
jgi:hypothetical protein